MIFQKEVPNNFDFVDILSTNKVDFFTKFSEGKPPLHILVLRFSETILNNDFKTTFHYLFILIGPISLQKRHFRSFTSH